MTINFDNVSAAAALAPGSALAARPGPAELAGPLEEALHGEPLSRAGASEHVAVGADAPAAGALLSAAGWPSAPDEAPGFSSGGKRGRLECRGAVLAEGPLRLTGCSLEGAAPHLCRFTLDCAGHPWAQLAAQKELSTLGIRWSAVLNAAAVERSWTAGDAVVFAPVERHGGDPLPDRTLSAEDYHPFIRVADVAERIFAEAGYRLESEFMSSEWFRSLMVSGRYPQRDVSAAERRMNFLAGRTADASAAADAQGTVAADPVSHYFSVGNLVDTADPRAADAPEGVFDNGGCFRMPEGAAAFVPPSRVTVAFEYDLFYRGTCRILSRERLEGFDTITLSPGDVRRLRIPNRYEDALLTGWHEGVSYRAFVFGARAEAEYRVMHVTAELVRFTGRSGLFTMPSGVTGKLQLQWRERPDGAWAGCSEDWALYYGYVAEQGTVSVRAVLRGAAETLPGGRSRRFDGVRFGGAREGDSFTLLRGTTVRPVFSPHPGEGERLTFSTVFSYSASRLDFLRAVAHLFDLRFYTDRLRGRVVAEPAATFYRSAPEVDMTERGVPGEPLWVEEPCDGLPRRVRLCYRPSEEPGGAGTDGGYTAVLPPLRTDDGDTLRIENPLLSAAASVAGTVAGAPSARLTLVGGSESAAPPDDLNFAPVIVRWLGMAPLPEGERWGWPSYGSRYPLAAFELPDGAAEAEPFTLSFGDTARAAGLHGWYGPTLRRAARARRVRATLRMRPEEFEALVRPSSEARDFRAQWVLSVGGERGRYRLLEAGDYDPETWTVKCLFIKSV